MADTDFPSGPIDLIYEGRSRDPAAFRPQPLRDGPDFWPTPPCLTSALVQFVLPTLSPAPIWECAAGDGRLARAIAATGRQVIATDLYPQNGSVERRDFLRDEVPEAARGSVAVTNPPNNQLNEFIWRGLSLLDCGALSGLVLLFRHDYLQAKERVHVFNRASDFFMCSWRPIWIKGTKGPPRWSFHWGVWLPDRVGAPVSHFLQAPSRMGDLFE